MYCCKTNYSISAALIKKLTLAVSVCFFCFSSFSQNGGGKNHINTGFEFLYSTHSTHFPGVSVEFERDLSKLFSVGAGIEFSYSKYHDDNGWDLYKLNFAPFYLTQKFKFLRIKKHLSYLRFRQGYTFINYDKQPQNNTAALRRHVREAGFYGYAAVGTHYNFTPKLGVLLEAGIKSFHISTNALDVNPHGVTFKLGAVYNF